MLPVLTASIPLPTSLSGLMAQGSIPLTFDVAHATRANDPAIGHVGFAVTYDGGKTYHDLPVTAATNHAGGHSYRTVLPNTSDLAGKAVGIRLTAADADGGKITETVQAAYRVASS